MSVQLPEISPNRVFTVDGQKIEVTYRLKKPHVLALSGLVSPEECQELIDYAISKNPRRSHVIDVSAGGTMLHDARTSSGVCFNRFETPLIERIERRIAEMTNWPVERGEPFQVLFYEKGQEYRPHFDWFDVNYKGNANEMYRGGQRVASTIVILKAADRGGGTTFPNGSFDLYPPAGGAVFFRNLMEDSRPDPYTLHGGAPVEEGQKVIMTLWQRERKFV